MLRVLVATAGVLLIGWAATGNAAPCGGFTDVDDTNPATAGFCANVTWMKNRGITLGCPSTGAPRYCPNDPVSRLQMAAFMNRLGDVTFQQDGNAFGATAVLGTTDNQLLELIVNGAQGLRLRQDAEPNFSGVVSVIGGHASNVVSRTCSPGFDCHLPSPIGGTIAGGGTSGSRNRVTDHFGSIGGGVANIAGNQNADGSDANYATVGGGYTNQALGLASTVPGGSSNTAIGNYSFAAGRGALSVADGCFTWADNSVGIYACTGANAFTARASGGVYFRTNAAATVGVDLFAGASSWSMASDRALKENIAEVDASEILDRLMRVPIATWNYLAQDRAIRHMGAMAQDLHAAFGLGESDKHISTIDADGIALAAIQGLNAKLEATVAEQGRENARLRAELAELRSLKEEVARIRAAQSAR